MGWNHKLVVFLDSKESLIKNGSSSACCFVWSMNWTSRLRVNIFVLFVWFHATKQQQYKTTTWQRQIWSSRGRCFVLNQTESSTIYFCPSAWENPSLASWRQWNVFFDGTRNFCKQKRPNKQKCSKVRCGLLRPGNNLFHNVWSFSKYDFAFEMFIPDLPVSYKSYKFGTFWSIATWCIGNLWGIRHCRQRRFHVHHFRSKDVIKTSEFLFQRIRRKCWGTFDDSGICQSPLWRIYDTYMHISYIYVYTCTYVRICHDLLPEFVGRVFQG